jgi:hypothetical protein
VGNFNWQTFFMYGSPNHWVPATTDFFSSKIMLSFLCCGLRAFSPALVAQSLLVGRLKIEGPDIMLSALYGIIAVIFLIEMLQQKKESETHIQITDLVLADGNAGGTEVLLKMPMMN